MEAILLLADAAEQGDPGSTKISALGIGWDRTTTPLPPHVLVVLIKVPWTDTNRRIPIVVDMVTEDGHEVMLPTPIGDQPLKIEGVLEVGRPPGIAHGSTITVPQIVQAPVGLLIAPGAYTWRVEIDGELKENWVAPFTVVGPAA
jgi:hypothetical protein